MDRLWQFALQQATDDHY